MLDSLVFSVARTKAREIITGGIDLQNVVSKSLLAQAATKQVVRYSEQPNVPAPIQKVNTNRRHIKTKY